LVKSPQNLSLSRRGRATLTSMPDLSIGANISWQIAAHEAAATRFQFIEKEHLFIGICSLEKILKLSHEDSGLNQKERKALQDEYETLQAFLKDL